MFGIINFETFIVAAILLNVTPGADTMYILGRSVAQGKKAGILSVFGISSGSLIHCIFAALGLSIILAKSALVFSFIKYLGAVYLIYLGIRLLASRSDLNLELENKKEQAENSFKIYTSGVLTNILNPKVALFFLAFLPQFIDPGHVESSMPFIILGLTFITSGTIWCIFLALFASRLSDSIRKNYKIKKWLDSAMGGMFILLGLKLALEKK